MDPEDELSDIQSDSVPSEVRDWLASTFTRQRRLMARRNEDKPRFRSIVHAVQAGIFVERSGLFVLKFYLVRLTQFSLAYCNSHMDLLVHLESLMIDPVFMLSYCIIVRLV